MPLPFRSAGTLLKAIFHALFHSDFPDLQGRVLIDLQQMRSFFLYSGGRLSRIRDGKFLSLRMGYKAGIGAGRGEDGHCL
jgi:hypothetical protein